MNERRLSNLSIVPLIPANDLKGQFAEKNEELFRDLEAMSDDDSGVSPVDEHGNPEHSQKKAMEIVISILRERYNNDKYIEFMTHTLKRIMEAKLTDEIVLYYDSLKSCLLKWYSYHRELIKVKAQDGKGLEVLEKLDKQMVDLQKNLETITTKQIKRVYSLAERNKQLNSDLGMLAVNTALLAVTGPKVLPLADTDIISLSLQGVS